MKCGTNELGGLLSRHKAIKLKPVDKDKGETKMDGQMNVKTGGLFEQHFLTKRHEEPFSLDGRTMYAHMLADTDGGLHNLTFDKSPSYGDVHVFPQVPSVAKRLLPSSKAIAVVCEPIERAWSQFHHDKRLNIMPYPMDSFDDLLPTLVAGPDSCEQEQDERARSRCRGLNSNYGEKGYYANHLKVWQRDFGHDNVMVIHLDDLNGQNNDNRRDQTIERLLKFLGLPSEDYQWDLDRKERVKARYHNTMESYKREVPSDVRQALTPYYHKHNEDLGVLLGEDFPRAWNTLPQQ